MYLVEIENEPKVAEINLENKPKSKGILSKWKHPGKKWEFIESNTLGFDSASVGCSLRPHPSRHTTESVAYPQS